jgi:glycosyl hydrolase family 39 (putative alpha-L-iduronidase)
MSLGVIVIRRFYTTALIVLGMWTALAVCREHVLTSTPPSQPIPATFFALHIHNAATTTPWPEVPFAEWRLWDSYVAWPNLEPQRGQWHFEVLDHYVSLAEQHNVSLLLPLGLSPTWASARPDEKSTYQPGNAAEPRDIQDWRNYVKTVAKRYKGRIHEYEIWNEPNLKGFWTGDTTEMVKLTREAAEIIREIDPHATIVSPSATTEKGIAWLSEFLQQGGGQWVDVIGYHFYAMPQPPETAVPLIQKVRQIMEDNAVSHKPLWNTETGWALPKPFPSPDLAAAYVVRTYVLNWAGGVQRLYWYAWDNHNWVTIQLTEADGKTPTSAGRAYETAGKWLVGATLKQCDVDQSHTWICELNREGASEWLVWNTDHTPAFALSAAWHVGYSTSLKGESKALSTSSFVIGPAPVLFSSSEPKTALRTVR